MLCSDDNTLPQTVYHGTDSESARDIAWNGVDMEKCTAGYFGVGFYTALDESLARSNYADFHDGEGVVLSFDIAPDARILDLRSDEDFALYQQLTGNGKYINQPRFLDMMRDAGIDGLYDNSFGGIVFFNRDALLGCEVVEKPKPVSPRQQ